MPVNVVDGYIFKILARIGLAANIPALQVGELAYDTDTKTGRLGDGTSAPPRIMTDKSTGIFNFQFMQYARFPRIEIVPGGKVDSVDISTMNQDAGFVVRIADGVMANRKIISGNATISITNQDGVSGDLDVRVTDELVTQLTPPKFWVSDVEPQSPRIGDFWHDTDGIDDIDGNADDGIVYIRNTDGVTEYWTQISNEYQNATETEVGLTRYATVEEALARVLNTVALTPRSITALIGAGNDFRTVLSGTTTAPPGSPVALDAYLVPIGASGAWSTHIGKVATWDGAIWIYDELRLGAFVVDSSKAQSSGLRFLQQTATLTWSTLNASEAGPGIIEIATQAETDAGTDDSRSVTPLKLKNYIPKMSAYLPIYPEITTGNGLFSYAVTPGQIVISNNNWLLHRGVNLYKSEDFNIALRTFVTVANASYHLRWYAPGHARAVTITGNNYTSAFALESLGWVGYNAGGLNTLNGAFDSTYDSVLLASVTTNGSNILTVAGWYNRAVLTFQFDTSIQSNAGYAGNFSVNPGLDNAIYGSITLPAYNWARTPRIYSHQATIGWGTGAFSQEPAISGAANNIALTSINRQIAALSGYTDYKAGDGPFVLASNSIYMRAVGSFWA